MFIAGYPKSLGLIQNTKYNFNRPLLRKGVIAGIDIKSMVIVVDCPVYPGNSGGPVITQKIINQDNGIFEKTELIGLVSEFIPFVEYWENKRYGYSNTTINNSGFSIVEPMDEILNLINSF